MAAGWRKTWVMEWKGVPLVYLLTAVYWAYLIFTSKMNISADAIGYEQLGRFLQQHGLMGYFVDGPHREPLFPLSISFSMTLANLWNGSYQYVQKFLHLAVILWSQVIMVFLMRRLKISPVVMAGTLLYFGLSPAVVNSGMSLFSEILTYPFVLLIVLFAVQAYQEEGGGLWRILLLAVSCAVSVLGLIFIKATFEMGYVIYFLPFCILAIALWIKGNKKRGVLLIVFYIGVISIVAGACHIYKKANAAVNGWYSITDNFRGIRAVYGNAVRRTEFVFGDKAALALASVPGQGVCRKFFTEGACDSWFFAQSDSVGIQHFLELTNSGVPASEIGRRSIHDAVHLVQAHPFRYGFFYIIESWKSFFWESTKIGHVAYPLWLQKIYEMGLLREALRFLLALLTVLALGYNFFFLFGRRSLDQDQRVVLAWSLWMIVLWAVLLSFGSILTRYIFPVVPLFLLQISFAMDHFRFRLAARNKIG